MSNSTIQAAIKKGWFGLDRMALIWTGDLSTELTIDGTIHEGFDISQKGADDSFFKMSDAFSKDQIYLGSFTVGLGKTTNKANLGIGANIYLALTAKGELAATVGYTVKNEEYIDVGFDYVSEQSPIIYNTVQSKKNEQSVSVRGEGSLTLAVSPGVGLLVGVCVPALVQVNTKSVTTVKGEGIFRSLYPAETSIEFTSDGYIDVMARAGLEAKIGPVNYSGYKKGYIDNTGRMVIQPKYDNVGKFCEGLAFFYDPAANKYGFMDKSGNEVIQPQFDWAYDHGGEPSGFSEGLAPVRIGKWDYTDKNGTMIIQPQFDYADSFTEGLAEVWMGAKRSYIDKTGRIIWTEP